MFLPMVCKKKMICSDLAVCSTTGLCGSSSNREQCVSRVCDEKGGVVECVIAPTDCAQCDRDSSDWRTGLPVARPAPLGSLGPVGCRSLPSTHNALLFGSLPFMWVGPCSHLKRIETVFT